VRGPTVSREELRRGLRGAALKTLVRRAEVPLRYEVLRACFLGRVESKLVNGGQLLVHSLDPNVVRNRRDRRRLARSGTRLPCVRVPGAVARIPDCVRLSATHASPAAADGREYLERCLVSVYVHDFQSRRDSEVLRPEPFPVLPLSAPEPVVRGERQFGRVPPSRELRVLRAKQVGKPRLLKDSLNPQRGTSLSGRYREPTLTEDHFWLKERTGRPLDKRPTPDPPSEASTVAVKLAMPFRSQPSKRRFRRALLKKESGSSEIRPARVALSTVVLEWFGSRKWSNPKPQFWT
jgi:hypothetical protein